MKSKLKTSIKLNSQLVLVEFDIYGWFLYRFESRNKITKESVARYLKETEGFNDGERDFILFVDDPDSIRI